MSFSDSRRSALSTMPTAPSTIRSRAATTALIALAVFTTCQLMTAAISTGLTNQKPSFAIVRE